MITPWGKADHKEIIADGITFYSTPSHGGFYVSAKLRQVMPKQYVLLNGWYEEDCEAVKVILAFPQYFTEDQVRIAHESFNYWYLPNGESKRK